MRLSTSKKQQARVFRVFFVGGEQSNSSPGVREPNQEFAILQQAAAKISGVII
jgi:hypothetical protein